MQRDQVSREHAENILAAQATREERLAVADDIINNNGTPGCNLSMSLACTLAIFVLLRRLYHRKKS